MIPRNPFYSAGSICGKPPGRGNAAPFGLVRGQAKDDAVVTAGCMLDALHAAVDPRTGLRTFEYDVIEMNPSVRIQPRP